jgi:hypothetical protein
VHVNHPINKVLKNFININEINTNIKYFEGDNFRKEPEMDMKFNNYLSDIKNNVKSVYTILFPIYTEISVKHKNKMKYILEPSDEFTELISETMCTLNIVKGEYTLIHIRSGDAYLIDAKNLDELYFIKIRCKLEILCRSHKKYILISDNLVLKQRLTQCIPTLKCIYEPITHLGEGLELNDEHIKNTMIDFYLIAYASSVFAFSCYEHGSGFSRWISETYGVEYTMCVV